MTFEMPTEANPVVVVCGDALDVLRALPDGCVDAVVTDPPYFRTVTADWDNQWDDADDYLAWLRGLCDEWERLLAQAGSLYVFASPQMAGRVEGIVRGRFDVLNTITWAKPVGTLAEKYGVNRLRGYVPVSERIIFAAHSPDAAVAYLRRECEASGLTPEQLTRAWPLTFGGSRLFRRTPVVTRAKNRSVCCGTS